MIAALLSFIYISFLCTLIGVTVLSMVGNTKFSWTHYMVAGIIAITVYAEFFSLFAKIGACAHIILLSTALIMGYVRRNTLLTLWKSYCPILFSWEGFFYLCFMLFVAFFTSRGEFHTDTNIYHAAAIRLYEEYGLIKGVGNLQLHYAYNSAYLAFASIFSLNWLFGRSLHTTTGWLELIMCLYAFHGLKDFKRHECHISDMMRVGILFYTLVILTRSMSPATDYATMLFAMFIITAWCENSEGIRSASQYSLLSAAAVFVVTLKFSACILVLLAIYPAICLVKEKSWKEIAEYILCGCMILAPFFIRNYFISGWLLYPFDGIDLFSVEWKIPKEYMRVDASQIKVWGRCLYDVAKEDWPVSNWLPIWWEHQERYEKMFLGAVVLGAVLQIIMLSLKILKRQKIKPELVILHLVIWGNLAVWFFLAPFIRYGLAFLFAVIMIAAGECISEKKRGIYSILTGSLLFCIVVSVSPYWDRYITDAGVFFKQNLTEPYYVVQKDYDEGRMESCEINGNRIYFATEDEINSYHTYVGTCYKFMLDRSTLIGDRIEDGFRAK